MILYNIVGDNMVKEIKIDFLHEALSLMGKILTNKDEDLNVYNNYINMASDKLLDTFSRYFDFKEKVLKEVEVINPNISPYFEDFIYREPFILNFYQYQKSHQYARISDAVQNFFIENLQEFTNQEIKSLDLETFISLINSLDLKDNEKLRVINFYIKGPEIYETIINAALKIEKIIKKYYYLVEGDINKLIDYLQTIDLETKINDVIKFKYFQNTDFSVCVSVMNFNSLFLQRYENSLNVYLGYLVFTLKDIKELKALEDKKVLNILKAISEPTRFKILRLLKNKEMYVQEIANEIELTSATLVHHLELLLNESLIEIVDNNLDKKRIFYKINNNTINEFTKLLGELLK